MEACVANKTPACQNIINNCGSVADPSDSTNYSPGDLSMDDLRTCLTEVLSVEHIETSSGSFNPSFGENYKDNVAKEDEHKDSDKMKSSNSASEEHFSKCAASLDEPKSSVAGSLSGVNGQEDDKTSEASKVNLSAKSFDQCHSQSIWQTSPLKLVSAMKGSRKKQGTAPKKLSVTWAPDVYDPTPTAASHVPSNKNQHYRNDGKKHGKNKQKRGGKSSRGSRGKDKKQARKNSADSAKLKPLHDDDVIDSTEPLGGVADFHGASPDPFCGSSFLKKSVATLHFPVTEAT
ncbi:hypothetical protein Salat_0999900 [Sesamum alatum]|uniref:Uncharacterized protein n=1 Tax=Sesamum alatum TaxID=300844 RepID=A0AAE2CS27_9LAMI|nr:hypothetical protein Salat_0999900 [Sesamum alatum]